MSDKILLPGVVVPCHSVYVSDRGDLGLAKREPRLEWSWWTESFDSWEDRQGQNRRPRLRWLYKHTRAILVQHDTDTRTRTHTQAQMAGSHRHRRRVNTHTASAAAMVLHHHSLYPTEWPATPTARSILPRGASSHSSTLRMQTQRPSRGRRTLTRTLLGCSDARAPDRRGSFRGRLPQGAAMPLHIANGMRAAVGSEKL